MGKFVNVRKNNSGYVTLCCCVDFICRVWGLPSARCMFFFFFFSFLVSFLTWLSWLHLLYNHIFLINILKQAYKHRIRCPKCLHILHDTAPLDSWVSVKCLCLLVVPGGANFCTWYVVYGCEKEKAKKKRFHFELMAEQSIGLISLECKIKWPKIAWETWTKNRRSEEFGPRVVLSKSDNLIYSISPKLTRGMLQCLDYCHYTLYSCIYKSINQIK